MNAKLAAFTPQSASKTYVAIKGQTNYCTGAIETFGYEHPDAPALFLLSQAMSTEFLHREIREKGGAYGGGSSFVPSAGIFYFSSYRDPNTLETIETFQKACEWAAQPSSITKTMVEVRKRMDRTTAFRQTIAPVDDITLRCNHSTSHFMLMEPVARIRITFLFRNA